MKMGIRKPSIKKSVSARTTGKVKRKLKRMTNPLYGKKGMGWIRNPKKALYNKTYHKTTVSTQKSMGCLVACIWYPVYWSCLLTWWLLKYTFLATCWAGVACVNACIWIIEKIINIGGQEQEAIEN